MDANKEIALELRALLDTHSKNEKHIGYHILPERLNTHLAGTGEANRYTFHERERLAFFLRHVDFKGKKVLDIGCNIGYFLFEALDRGAERVIGYEGKKSCGAFVESAIQRLGEKERFEFHNEYFQFERQGEHYDIAILLNVLHHLGDDYGSGKLGMDEAKAGMLLQLNSLSDSARTLIFQMGFNWKGDRHSCLLANGTKAEMIDFVRQGTAGYWDIAAIGIAGRTDQGISYSPLSEENIERNDALGEFLNRPIFILHSKHI